MNNNIAMQRILCALRMRAHRDYVQHSQLMYVKASVSSALVSNRIQWLLANAWWLACFV
jgi:hypothetical protein